MEGGAQQVDVRFQAPVRPVDDLDALIEFMSSTFTDELSAIQQLTRRTPRYRADLRALYRRALAFRILLGQWLAVAERLHADIFADQFDTEHEARSAEHASTKGGLRPSAKQIEAQARQQAAPLQEAVDKLKAARDDMRELAFAAQTDMRTMQQDELTGEAEGVSDFDTPNEQFDRKDAALPDAVGRLPVLQK